MPRTGGVPLTPVAGLLMAGIAAMAPTRIMARRLSRTGTAECQAFWLMVSHGVTGFALLAVMPPVTFPGSPALWGAPRFLGVSSGLAHVLFTRADGLAPVSALAPYEYTMLLGGGLAGFVVFGEGSLGDDDHRRHDRRGVRAV